MRSRRANPPGAPPHHVPAPDARAGRSRKARAAAALCLALAFLYRPACAEERPEQKLKAVEKALEESRQSQTRYSEQADALAAELAQLRESSVTAAKAAQDNEAAISRLEEQLAQLAGEEAAKTADLRHRSGQSVELLMALQRLARDPPEALALAPGKPVDTARSAILLGAAIPQIQAKARALRSELAALAALRGTIDEKRQQLVADNDALTKEAAALKTLAARKAVLQDRAARGAEISGQRLAQLSTEAGDLRELLERLEAEKQQRAEEERQRASELLARAAVRPPRAAPEPPKASPPGQSAHAVASLPPADIAKPKNLRPFPAAHGTMIMPVAGKLTRRYGESDEIGAASKGIVIEARPGGQVVAPFDGRIEFAGPFRGYGQILIIEHGDGYHSLLAGLERIDGVVGQWLVAGEPVGTMPTDGHGAALYVELRHHEQPINPLPWLATRDDKVSG